MWLKLFRRLSSYFGAGSTSLDGFDAWLRADTINRDDFVLLPDMEVGNMHDLIAIDGNKLKMLYGPEDVVILPGGTAPPVAVTPPVDKTAAPVRIVAALANPAGAEIGKETVTLFNASPNPIDFSTRWAIVDRANQRESIGGTLEAGEAVRIKLKTVRLNNDGDTITLFDDKTNQIDQVSYSAKDAKKEGWSIIF